MSIRKISSMNPDHIRISPVPLKMDSIKEYFENKELFFLVDYSQSQIKGNMFLTYISNLDLPCEILLEGTSKEEKKSLLKNYMESRNLANSDVLRLGAAHAVLRYRNTETEGFYQNPVLTHEEQDEFIAENQELLRRWDQFISSTLIYMLQAFPALETQL